MLRQQRANATALAAVVRRAEAEALCLQREEHGADQHAAALARAPRVRHGAHRRDPRARGASPPHPTNPAPPILSAESAGVADVADFSRPADVAANGHGSATAPSAAPPPPLLPARAELLRLLALYEGTMRQRLATAEARCQAMDGRMAAIMATIERRRRFGASVSRAR